MGISTRQQNSWQQRLKDAESDEDIIRLRDSMKRKGVDPDSYPALQLTPTEGEYQTGGAAQADDANALTKEELAHIGRAWRELIEDRAHNGKLRYVMPNVRGMPPRNSFQLPRDVVNKLGDGDPKAGGAVIHQMFGVEDDPADPTLIHGDVVRIIGGGNLAKGHKILTRFTQMVRRQGTPQRIEQPDGHSPDRTLD